MKNIHLIPTDKPSRLSILNSGKLNFGAEFISSSNSKAQHIYITSDEEIKEGDWVYCRIENRVLVSNVSYSKLDNRFKIILTTDQDLIKDGVQAIDNDFLEWFVKNPSCEEVKVNDLYEYPNVKHIGYKIIIPKEEPKQEYNNLNYGGGFTEEDIKRVSEKKLKQETLEEASQYYAHNYFDMHETNNYKALKQGFEAGAEWLAERMYEIMNAYADDVMGGCNLRAKEWFEQNKNK